MRFYLAPLEGVTGHVFREAYDRFFHDVDRYYTPFLSANDHLNFKTKRELGLCGGDGLASSGQSHAETDQCASAVQSSAGTVALHAPLVPQILGNRADQVLALIEEIRALRPVDEINLNFGCPSGTVTAKNRGAGIFKDLIAMDDFLDRLFTQIGPGGRGSRAKNDKNEPQTPSRGVKISVKTRIGWADESEWEKIVRIYADYPFSEIIIHPRVRADQYRGACRTQAFAYALEHLDVPLCYNGEIHSVEAYLELCKLFPKLDAVMIGRGIVKDPFLITDIRRAQEAGAKHPCPERTGSESNDTDHSAIERTPEEKQILRDFVRTLEESYLKEMQCEEHAVMRMKEFWLYFGTSFPDSAKALKAIKKAGNLQEYRTATLQIPW